MQNTYGAITRITAKQRENFQARARPLRLRYSVDVDGIGETRLDNEQAIPFNAFLLEEPSFSFGVVARSEIPVGEMPLATATVLQWLKNDRGLYYAADMGFRVVSKDQNIQMTFSLTFEGTALRTTSRMENPTVGDGGSF